MSEGGRGHALSGRHKVEKLAVAALILLLSAVSFAQESQFAFDLSGELFIQATETNAPPQILAQPQSQIVMAGELAAFSVLVADPTAIRYQWLFNGEVIEGAKSDSLVVTNVTAADQGQYSVEVANGLGSVTSNPAMLWYDGNTNGLPDSWELAYFGNLNQTATGDYDGDGVDNLDEFWEGTDPTDPTSFNPRLYIQTTDFGVAYGSPPQPYYIMGSVATVIAVPDVGATFLGWSGAAAGIKPEISLVMNGHKTILASFAEAMPPPSFLSANQTSSGISMTWSAAAGRWYQLQYTTDLATGAWTNLGGIVAATSPTLNVTDPFPSDTQRFYRVGVLP
ncbi:MAG: immunoglobulin domain-containing protein [Verrucomicrobiota bacterium]